MSILISCPEYLLVVHYKVWHCYYFTISELFYYLPDSYFVETCGFFILLIDPKICGFVISGLAHRRHFRIYYCGISSRIWNLLAQLHFFRRGCFLSQFFAELIYVRGAGTYSIPASCLLINIKPSRSLKVATAPQVRYDIIIISNARHHVHLS